MVRNDRGSEGSGYLRSRFTESTANGTRLIGFVIALASVVLPWASVARIENGFIQTMGSYNLIDLLLLGDPTTTLVVAAYLAGVAIALLHASSVVVVLAAWFVQDDVIRAYFMSTLPAPTPDVTYGVLFGIGSWLGLLAAFLFIVSIVAYFRGERYIAKGALQPSEAYAGGLRGAGVSESALLSNLRWWNFFTGRRRNERP